MTTAYDLVIIGGGPAGYTGAVRAAQLGLRTAIVERDRLGGICLHWGCVPTKVLLHTAELALRLREAETFGLEVGPVRIHYDRMHRRKAEVVEKHHKGVQYLMRKHKIDVFAGTGRLGGGGRVHVALNDGSETELAARATMIATGSAPRSIPGIEIDNVRVLDSTGALSLTQLPGSIAILGAGAVGAEFASLFTVLGSEVTLIELLPAVVPLEDPEVGRALERAFTRRGMRVLTGATATGVAASDSGVTVTVEKGGERQAVTVDYLLVAVGRAPLIDGLGLEAAGVAVERGAVKVDADYRTSAPGIYAVGDAIGGAFRLAHVAAAEAVRVAELVAGAPSVPIDYQAVPRPTFSIPQVAAMGLSEPQAVEAGHAVRVGRFPFSANAKASIEGERDGFVKVVSDAQTGELLGVHMVGPAVTELLAEAVMARTLEGTALEVAGAVHSHPTLSEAVREAALDALGRVREA
ncbi:MAG: dihydrolipoyl dehydrogenase [Armatimonadota bacterium]|nr:dihydrolipoyl dehydrogenase [Armatimonadota bacterium]MDR7422880.1 dihydrolipoyl dehydrogenase [Armatimonadota bacterium]MDR7454382.1 dihydrolipoyl dehydrogenase [Armatimonadota bacterium]MDR7455931.1 dihydrolipoyl dehydrogenase [Armatimonadota bacterium]MDR7498058.1 dihydrolipoyl dehydrogenase [Armatimonadota bacterium]